MQGVDLLFTLHNALLKTGEADGRDIVDIAFTLHNALLKTKNF